MNCEKCGKDISAKKAAFTFAEQKVCESCFQDLCEASAEEEMKEQEMQSKLESGW